MLCGTNPDGALLLGYHQGALSLVKARSRDKPVMVDLVDGKAGHRRKFGGDKGQDIATTVGLNKGATPAILDTTIGQGLKTSAGS